MDYLKQVEARLTRLLKQTPEDERADQMQACVRTAGAYLHSNPSMESPSIFSRELFEDQGMKQLVQMDEYRLAMSAEIPEELVNNLVPPNN